MWHGMHTNPASWLQIAGQSNAGQSNAVSGQSRQNTAFQQAPSWTSQYLQQQPQPQQQQSLWMPQQQRQQATHYFIQQAQAIWEKMGLASMGVAMPQSFEQVYYHWVINASLYW